MHGTEHIVDPGPEADAVPGLTVSNQLQQRQVQGPLPARVLVQSDAVACGGEHLSGADGHDLQEEKAVNQQAHLLSWV